MNPAYQYEVHLPANMDPGKKYPVVFTLHGKGSNERNMFGIVSPLADDFIIIGIRGNLMLGAGYQYYELKSLGNPIREMFDEAVKQLEAFIEYASEKYPIDLGKRYLLGFSQGAILSMSLALTMGDRLKGIVALNGYVPDFVKTELLPTLSNGFASFYYRIIVSLSSDVWYSISISRISTSEGFDGRRICRT
jgi:phospholipase/carboxylesterase